MISLPQTRDNPPATAVFQQVVVRSGETDDPGTEQDQRQHAALHTKH